MHVLLPVYEELYAAFGPQEWWPARTRFEVIIGAILTQNTAWKNVERAIENLRREKLLSVKALCRAPLSKIRDCVRPAGYFNQKARYAKELACYLERYYSGNLSRFFSQPTGSLRRELLSLKGIGRETADSILLYAGGKSVFVVDAYTRRVFSRLGVLRGDECYEKVRALFEKNLPRNEKIYGEFHALIVKLGKSVCLKREPLCAACPLRARCRFARFVRKRI